MRRFHSHLLRILKRSPQPAPGQGFTLAEPLVFIVLMALTVAGAAAMITISSRGTIGARIQSQQATAIEDDLNSIKQLSERFTCCTGTCTTEAPPVDSVGPDRVCATSNPQQDEYYFPQRAITPENSATPELEAEPDRVDDLCSSDQNAAFLGPLQSAIDAITQPSGLSRSSAIANGINGLPIHLIQITYRSGTAAGPILRVVNIVPPMANYCS